MSFCSPLWLSASALLTLKARMPNAVADSARSRFLLRRAHDVVILSPSDEDRCWTERKLTAHTVRESPAEEYRPESSSANF
jgi:hypothetical protein